MNSFIRVGVRCSGFATSLALSSILIAFTPVSSHAEDQQEPSYPVVTTHETETSDTIYFLHYITTSLITPLPEDYEQPPQEEEPPGPLPEPAPHQTETSKTWDEAGHYYPLTPLPEPEPAPHQTETSKTWDDAGHYYPLTPLPEPEPEEHDIKVSKGS